MYDYRLLAIFFMILHPVITIPGNIGLLAKNLYEKNPKNI